MVITLYVVNGRQPVFHLEGGGACPGIPPPSKMLRKLIKIIQHLQLIRLLDIASKSTLIFLVKIGLKCSLRGLKSIFFLGGACPQTPPIWYMAVLQHIVPPPNENPV